MISISPQLLKAKKEGALLPKRIETTKLNTVFGQIEFVACPSLTDKGYLFDPKTRKGCVISFQK